MSPVGGQQRAGELQRRGGVAAFGLGEARVSEPAFRVGDEARHLPDLLGQPVALAAGDVVGDRPRVGDLRERLPGGRHHIDGEGTGHGGLR